MKFKNLEFNLIRVIFLRELENKGEQIDPTDNFIDPLTCDRFQFTLLVIHCPTFSHLTGTELEDLIEKMLVRARIVEDSMYSGE